MEMVFSNQRELYGVWFFQAYFLFFQNQPILALPLS